MRGREIWTKEEEELLEKGYRSGMTPVDLGAQHQRTPAACVSRLERMGVLVGYQGAYYELPKEPYVTVREMMNLARARSE